MMFNDELEHDVCTKANNHRYSIATEVRFKVRIASFIGGVPHTILSKCIVKILHFIITLIIPAPTFAHKSICIFVSTPLHQSKTYLVPHPLPHSPTYYICIHIAIILGVHSLFTITSDYLPAHSLCRRPAYLHTHIHTFYAPPVCPPAQMS